MKVINQSKRITLFPYEIKAITFERLSDFINPIMKLGFLPQAKKGLSIKFDNEKNENIIEDSWGVDFISDEEESFKISINGDRVDLTSNSNKSWVSFKEECNPIINKLRSIFAHGFSRLALGYIITKEGTKEELLAEGFVDVNKVDQSNIREFMTQEVKLLQLEEDPQLKYNHVITQIYNPIRENYKFKIGYDINTLPELHKTIIERNESNFFNKIVNQLQNLF